MSDRSRTITGLALAAAIVAFVVLVVMSPAEGTGGDSIPNDTDGAFITGMAAHHRTAVEMSGIAVEEAERPQVKKLARRILSDRKKEIAALDDAHRRIYGEPVPANGMPHGGPAPAPFDLEALASARRFDRAFLDEMIRHHRAALKMAEAEIGRGGDAEVKRIARDVASKQTREIETMSAWRAAWYGGS